MITITFKDIIYNFPSKASEIKLRDYLNNRPVFEKNIELIDDDDILSIISYYTDLDINELIDIDYNQFSEIGFIFVKAITESITDVKKEITINGVEYGIIPRDFSYITMREKGDIETYYGDVQSNIHNILSIIMRPIVKRYDDGNYEIEPYDAQICKSRSELFLDESFQLMSNVVGFFFALRIRLETLTKLYSNESIKTPTEKS